MEQRATTVPMTGELSARVIRKNGTIEELGVISKAGPVLLRRMNEDVRRMRRLLYGITGILLMLALAGMFFLVRQWLLLALVLSSAISFALVTNAGAAYMASDFAGGGVSPHIGAFNFHDDGTGTTAAAVTDTALQTPTGGSRVAGTQSSPSSQVYRSVATISFTGSFAITEWGLFSASTSGTLWDRRVFSAINVASGDSIQYTYNLTVNSGGT